MINNSNFGYILYLLIAAFVFVESLLLNSAWGVWNVMVLILFWINSRQLKKNHTFTFRFAISTIAIAYVLFMLDKGQTFELPIKKFSEWSYFFILLGALQLLFGNVQNKSKR